VLEQGEIDIDPGYDKLAAQLGSIKWGIDSRGRIKIKSKDDMRKRGLPSPDRADTAPSAFSARANAAPMNVESHAGESITAGSNDQGLVGHRVQNAGPPFDDEHLGSRCSALPGGWAYHGGWLCAEPWPATAAPPDNFPDRIDLPDGFFPEGIESGRGTSVFVGSLIDGAIWRGDLRTASGAVLADGETGRVSVGIAYEASRNRLWVAGGGPGFNAGVGDVRVYDASSGDLLATFLLPAGDVGALNDVAITHDAVYVTDSFRAQLVVIPLPADGSLPSEDAATLLPVTGDFVQTPPPDPNFNGIVAKSGVLLVAHTSMGKLFRVDPDTGIAAAVDLGGEPLPSPDGLELRGNTLYVVGGGLVTVVRLGARLASGVVLGEITDPGLDVPTTATVAAGRLWVVNARFGTGPTPTTPYWITQLPLRPENG
jgi:hypothetical protein